MRTLPRDGGITTSIWTETDVPRYNSQPETETDVCIVGAGISGLTTAFELARRGTRVIVLDDGPIGGGETGRTTAHLASAVDDHYTKLENTFGASGAQLVAESHSMAIDYIEAISRELKIACEFRRVDGFLIKPPGHHPETHRDLEREMAAAQRAGLSCEMVDGAPLPFQTGPAVRFANQAELHPLAYLRGLAEAFVQLGGRIHTGVHVRSIQPGEPLHLQLAGGRTLLARMAVDATNSAFTSRTTMPRRQAAYRTYVLAFEIPRREIPHALYWDTLDPYHYLRIARGEPDHELLLVGGNDHRVAQGDPMQAWADLESWTRRWIPMVGKRVAHWSGQIIEPVDYLAHIGKSPELDHVYIVTGDSGNGLTHGTIAGMMIPELMAGNHPRFERLYDPSRNHLHTPGNLLREAVHSSAPYTDWLRAGDVTSVDDIRPGEGAVLRRGLHMVACYRDEAGTCHERSATCTHQRGVVHWNSAEKTWDCPCHGSRFDRHGRVVNGPAATDLMPIREPVERTPREERERTAIRLPVMPLVD
jgi:glycine/D-amino acid oxidase-like deaminating enzyme/nitrite reductase/ring-hydroxylating ferredoxin subunit